jgi:hypothetical protein
MAKMRFKLLTGKHVGPGNAQKPGKRYVAGDIISTDRDLAKAFGKEKFVLLKDDEIPKEEPKPEPVPEEPVATDTPKETEQDLGDDSTQDFDGAEGKGLSVFQKGKLFSVTEKGTKNVLFSSKKSKEVEEFISKYGSEA